MCIHSQDQPITNPKFIIQSYMKPTIKSYPHIILQQHYKLNISNEWQTPTILTHIATSTIYKSVPPPPTNYHKNSTPHLSKYNPAKSICTYIWLLEERLPSFQNILGAKLYVIWLTVANSPDTSHEIHIFTNNLNIMYLINNHI